MSLMAVEYNFKGPVSYYPTYDSTKTTLGSLMYQSYAVTGPYAGTGPTGPTVFSRQDYVGPLPTTWARLGEQPVFSAVTSQYIVSVLQYDANTDLVFAIDAYTTSVAAKPVCLYTYNKLNNIFQYKGQIYINMPAGAQAYTNVDFVAIRDIYTKGQASCAGGLTVSGSGTTWATDRIAGGARIGFGSQDPTQISTWYQLAATGPAFNDTTFYLNPSWATGPTGPTGPGATGPNTGGFVNYCIDELRFVYLGQWGAPPGGIGLTKGLNLDLFGPTGPVPTISLAVGPTGVDGIRGTYWLKAPGGTGPQRGLGLGLLPKKDWQTHELYVPNNPISSSGALEVWRVNLRAALSPNTAVDTGHACTNKGGMWTSPTSFATNVNLVEIATPQHGVSNNITSLFIADGDRILRIPTGGPTGVGPTGASGFVTDWMMAYPPIASTGPTGPTGPTFPVPSALWTISYLPHIDRFIVTDAAIGSTGKSYVTKYSSTGPDMPFPKCFEIAFNSDTKQLDSSTQNQASLPLPNSTYGLKFKTSPQGVTYTYRNYQNSTALSLVYPIPFAADWSYAAGTGPTGPNGPTGPGNIPYPGSTGPTESPAPYAPQRIITPSMSTPNAVELIRVSVNSASLVSGSVLQDAFKASALSPTPEAYRVYARTTGISDNTGSWTLINDTGDLTSLTAGTAIQFMFEFRIFSNNMLPARIFSISCIYEDNKTDSHYELSLDKSDLTSKYFVWRFKKEFNTTVPTLRVRIYNLADNSVQIDDNTGSPTGTFEKSTDGSSWVTWTNADKGNETTYLRYTPSGAASITIDGMSVKALLTRY